MTEASQQNAPAMDGELLAKLTGGLGDKRTIARIGAEIGQLYCGFLPDIFQSGTGVGIELEYAGCTSGPMVDLIRGFGQDFAIADCALRNWCPHFMLATGSAFVMTLMERMLGAHPDTILEPETRPLSQIELDLAALVLERLASVLRSGVNAPGGFEAGIEPPVNSAGKSAHEEAMAGQYGIAVRIKATIGKIASEFAVILPQGVLLKTKIVTPRPSAQALKKQEEWMQMISDQVKRSQVTLEAHIRLQNLKLKNVARLMIGDVIPFRDAKQDDICVEVSANGANMYNCEFGRAGDRYTVRVKNNVSTDDEILRHLMG